MRQGDITIADFKGLATVFPDLNGSKYNYSTIVSNNDKGEKVIKALFNSMEMRECSIEMVKKFNPLFYRHTSICKSRDDFFNKFKIDAIGAVKEFTVPAKVKHFEFKQAIWNSLPFCVRRKYKKLLKK